MSSANPNPNTEVPQTSPLLSLPGELRNIIYSHVLTSPSGLHYIQRPADHVHDPSSDTTLPISGDGRFYDSPTSTLEFNQLQYVSHQLRRETRGLEFQFNDTLHFSSLRETAAFVSTMPAHIGQHLETLHICDGGCGFFDGGCGFFDGGSAQVSNEKFQAIKEFCAAHAHITVRSRQPTLRPISKTRLLGLGARCVYVEYCARGRMTLLRRFITTPGRARDNLAWIFGFPSPPDEDVATCSPLPDNFRLCLMPENGKRFDQAAFEKDYRAPCRITELIRRGLRGGDDEYVCLMERIDEMGI